MFGKQNAVLGSRGTGCQSATGRIRRDEQASDLCSRNQLGACKIDACPRKNSAASIRRFPSSCTSPNESAPLPAAITSSLSRCKNSPGFPLRSTIAAEKIFNFRTPGVAISVNAPGHGLNARIFRSIISAGSDQSILPLSRVSFGA